MIEGCFSIKCDVCSQYLHAPFDKNSMLLTNSEKSIRRTAFECGWNVNSPKHYCKECCDIGKKTT